MAVFAAMLHQGGGLLSQETKPLSQKAELSSQAPLCPVAEACGGCPLILTPLETQRANKLSMVRALLSEALDFSASSGSRGKRFDAEQVGFYPEISPLAYRNRIRLRVDESGEFGFFNLEKDPACAVLLPELKLAVKEISLALDSVRQMAALFDHVEIRAPDLDARAGLFLSGQRVECFDESVRQALRDALGAVSLVGFAGAAAENSRPQQARDADQPCQRYALGSEVYQLVPLGDFMQVNFRINQQLIASLVAGAQARHLRSVLDLYCGAGNFILPLLAAGFSGMGVEINARSILAAQKAAHEQRLSGDFYAADVPSWLEEAAQNNSLNRLDLAIVDPPRAGLGKGVEHLLKLAPPFIAVCSCSPKSLARDLKALVLGGYEVESAELFDMFAHTRHVEVLVWLRRVS